MPVNNNLGPFVAKATEALATALVSTRAAVRIQKSIKKVR